LAQIFPKSANRWWIYVLAVVIGGAVATVGFFWYFGSPKFTDVGYRPAQPVEYSHKVHAGDLGIDCRYCHTQVERTAKAMVPPTQTCMNCHIIVKTDSPKMRPVNESWYSNQPIEWVKVHKVPDYAYFDHSAHISVGVGCETCHGNVAEMEEVMLVETLSMGWCLDCHNDPAPNLRPLSEVTNMAYVPGPEQKAFAEALIAEKNINPPINCSGCHR